MIQIRKEKVKLGELLLKEHGEVIGDLMAEDEQIKSKMKTLYPKQIASIVKLKQDIDEKSDIITAHELQLNEGPYTEGSKDLDSSELKAENERLTEELKVLKGECESNSKAKAGGGKRTLKKNFKRDRNKRTLRR